MKTNYRPRSNATSSRKRLWYVVGTLLLFMGAGIILRSFAFNVASPVWKGAESISNVFSVFTRAFQSKESLIRENDDLKLRLASYAAEVESLRLAADSRDALLATYGRQATTTGIAAAVLVHPPETPYDALVIDAGSDEGVHEGASILTPEGGLLGTVTQVSSHQSQVTLYSSSSIKTDAVLERGLIPVTLVGHGGGNFETDVPKDVVVNTGDRVLSPGLVSRLLGVVGDVETTPTDSAKHVRIVSPVNVTSVHFVLIK